MAWRFYYLYQSEQHDKKMHLGVWQFMADMMLASSLPDGDEAFLATFAWASGAEKLTRCHHKDLRLFVVPETNGRIVVGGVQTQTTPTSGHIGPVDLADAAERFAEVLGMVDLIPVKEGGAIDPTTIGADHHIVGDSRWGLLENWYGEIQKLQARGESLDANGSAIVGNLLGYLYGVLTGNDELRDKHGHIPPGTFKD